MKTLDTGKVREALALDRKARSLSDSDELMQAARNLRVLNRPERSLIVLDGIRFTHNGSFGWHLERSCTLAALGCPEEAVQEVRAALDLQPEAPVNLQLIATFGEALGSAAVGKANVRKLLSDTVIDDDPVVILNKISLRAVGKIPIGKLLLASGGESFRKKLRLLLHAMKLKATYRVLDLTALIVLAFFRLSHPTRDVRVASLGKFTRLADIVDRLDPVLRRLENETGARRKPLLIAFYYGGYPNETLLRLYEEHCRLLPLTGPVSRRVGMAAYSIIQQVDRHTNLTTDYREINNDFLCYPPVLRLPENMVRDMERQLDLLGVDPDKPLIGFGLRDMAYYKFYGTIANAGPSAGVREDTRHRCPPLESYIQAAEHWADRGYQVLRMGLRVSEALPDERNPLIFDYANKGRSDALDAYIFSRCRFLLAGDTGLFSGAAAFDRPCVVSDLFLVRNTIYSSNKKTRNIFVPKLVRDRECGRYLTFREWIYFNHHFSFAADCDRGRFELVHNEPEDLIDATTELMQRLDGTHEETRESVEMQQRFHEIYSPYQVGYRSTGLVSSRFLEKHSELLD